MTATEIPVDNGFNVQALLGVRGALAGTRQISQFQWRSTVSPSLFPAHSLRSSSSLINPKIHLANGPFHRLIRGS